MAASKSQSEPQHEAEMKSKVEQFIVPDDPEQWYAHVSALCFALTFVILGVPIWWRTTTVYRADLPFTEITKLTDTLPSIRFHFEVVLVTREITSVELADFGERLHNAFKDGNEAGRLVEVRYRGNVRQAHETELVGFAESGSINELERRLLDRESMKYTIYMVRGAHLYGLSLPHIGTLRDVFIELPKDMKQLGESISAIQQICGGLLDQSGLEEAMKAALGVSVSDQGLLRSVKFNDIYTVVFNLLVPQPEVIMASWDVATASQEYLAAFEAVLGKYVTLNIKSQVLYYEEIPEHISKKGEGHFYLSIADQPHLVTSVEARLGSFVDTNPTLNFVVYIPTEKQSPLYVLDEMGQRSNTDAFLIPRWGGFYIYNSNSTAGKPTHRVVDMELVLKCFLPQLKALLGFPTSFLEHSVSSSMNADGSLALWELDVWLKRRTLENIATATHTLGSLARLVQKIRNMVIKETISDLVHTAVAACERAHQQLAKGSPAAAFMESKQALCAAEKAFFDPSLLELLYFPEDQKFAIYIPLFLPIGIPLISSVVNAIKWFRRKTPKPKVE